MVVGIYKIDLFLPEIHSLKEKRGLLRRLTEKASQRFKIPVVEVGHQDLWQRSQIGFALVGSDRCVLEALGQEVMRFLEGMDLAQITARDYEAIDF